MSSANMLFWSFLLLPGSIQRRLRLPFLFWRAKLKEQNNPELPYDPMNCQKDCMQP